MIKGITDFGKLLSDTELVELRKVIVSNRHLLTHASAYWPEDESSLYFLGSPVYAAGRNIHLYQQYRPLTEEFLETHSTTVRKRFLDKIEELFKLPAEHIPNTSLPGFHVFSTHEGREKTYIIDDYHQDENLAFLSTRGGAYDNYRIIDIYSCLVAIQSPKSGAGLDYYGRGYQHYDYVDGHGYMWNASMEHKIGSHTLEDENDLRITFQFHFIVRPDKLLYYW